MKMVTNNSINTNSIIILSRYSYSPQYKVQLSIIIAIVKSHSTPLYSHPITSRYFSTMSTLWLLLCLHKRIKRMSNNLSSSNSHRRHRHRSRSHHIPPNDNLFRRYHRREYKNIRKSSNNNKNRSNSRRSSLMRSYRIPRLISLDKRMGRVNNNNKGRLRISSSLMV